MRNMPLSSAVVVFGFPLNLAQKFSIIAARTVYETLEVFDWDQVIILVENSQHVIYFTPEFEYEVIESIVTVCPYRLAFDVRHLFQPTELEGSYVRVQRLADIASYS